jgi:hypothetical protein
VIILFTHSIKSIFCTVRADSLGSYRPCDFLLLPTSKALTSTRFHGSFPFLYNKGAGRHSCSGGLRPPGLVMWLRHESPPVSLNKLTRHILSKATIFETISSKLTPTPSLHCGN